MAIPRTPSSWGILGVAPATVRNESARLRLGVVDIIPADKTTIDYDTLWRNLKRLDRKIRVLNPLSISSTGTRHTPRREGWASFPPAFSAEGSTGRNYPVGRAALRFPAGRQYLPDSSTPPCRSGYYRPFPVEQGRLQPPEEAASR